MLFRSAGTYAGQVCEVGDMVICISDGTVASSLDWTVVQSNIDPNQKADNHNGVYMVSSSHSTDTNIWQGNPLDSGANLYEQGVTIVYLLQQAFSGGSDVTLDIHGFYQYGSAFYTNGVPVYKNGEPFSETCSAGTIFVMHLYGPRYNIIAQTNLPESVPKNQGIANSGKLLCVNNDGSVTPVNPSLTGEILQLPFSITLN